MKQIGWIRDKLLTAGRWGGKAKGGFFLGRKCSGNGSCSVTAQKSLPALVWLLLFFAGPLGDSRRGPSPPR